MQIPSFILNLLHSGKEPATLLWDAKRIVIINFIILVAVPVFIFFTYLNIQHEQITFAQINLVIILLLLSTFILFRFNRDINYASTGILLSLLLTHIVTLFQGGIANTGFFWFFFFPLFAIMLQGKKYGLYWISVLLLVILAMYVYQLQNTIKLSYEPILLPILFISLGIESVVALFVESVRVKYDLQLQAFNHSLEERVSIEIQRNQQKDQLMQQQSKMAAMGEMSNYIAHQWKQPLAVISSIVSQLTVKESLEVLDHSTLVEDLSKIEAQVKNMSKTMVDFNNFAKPNSSKQSFKLEDSIEECLSMIRPLIESKDISITTEVLNTQTTVFGQQNFLTQVLLNLVNNAKDALIADKVSNPCIHIKTNKEGNKLEVSDNAKGVSPKSEGSIFDAYYSTKGDHNGGVGLHMCRRIIEDRFNGSLELHNSPNGATFIIFLKSSD